MDKVRLLIACSFIFALIFLNAGCNKHCIEAKCDSCGESGLLEGQSPDTVSSETRIRELDLFFQQKADQGQWFTALYSESGNILLGKGFGCAESCKVKNAQSTMFPLASLTKAFTAVGIAQLEEIGKLSNSDNLSRFFPDISDDKKEITIHQLLTHSGGLAEYHDKGGDFEKNLNREKILKRINKQELVSPPGASYNYSNSGFTLLAYIIEDLSGMSYRDYCTKHIFGPLEMNRTVFHGDLPLEKDMAFGYGDKCYNENKPGTWPWPGGAIYGNGGIVSTAQDLQKFIVGVQSGLLSETAWNQMIQPHIENPRYSGIYPQDQMRQGYGWELRNNPLPGNTIFLGGTTQYGFVCTLRFYEDQDAVLIILTNNFNTGTEQAVIGESAIQEIEEILF